MGISPENINDSNCKHAGICSECTVVIFEEWHLDMEEEVWMVCPQCGKSVRVRCVKK